MTNRCRKAKLVDLVFSEREESPLTPLIDALIDLQAEEIELNQNFVLDAICLRWALADILKGQGISPELTDVNPNMEVRVGE
ncbi:hypothetical protein VN12_05650 [Pirellula sp. SH-Sr6A]|nr:hypothetical protein VN12_05650 [Pirellula sp. SH-Sr6A]